MMNRTCIGVLVLTVLVGGVPAMAGWYETGKLVSSDIAAGDEFGSAVAVSGNTAIIGAKYDDDAANRSGSVYLFDTTTGAQLRKLNALDGAADDFFGCSVGISGNTAIVGARNHDAGGFYRGAAYLFDVTTGNQLAKLTASDAEHDDRFGSSVAISGSMAIVGAPGDELATGAAYLFNTVTGQQTAKLTASDGAERDFFGEAVGISGNVAIVGAAYDDDLGNRSGSAYLFDVTTGNQITKLTASDGAEGDLFGRSVAISGDAAIVGASLDSFGGTEYGSAYLFDTSAGTEIMKLTASDLAGGQFGWSVGISEDTAIVGAKYDSLNDPSSGSAYLYDVTTGAEITKLTASDAAAWDEFGYAVAISGSTAVVGTRWDDGTGSAYVFVPEPAAIVLLALGCVALTRRRG